MSQWIIIDWGDAPLRLIATTIRDRQVTLTRMAALPTASRREPAMLINTLQSWRVAKAQLVVVVDRADCEVRGFQVPPVPADELPDIVRFQALQHFVSLDDGSPIDFLPAQADNAEQVLAAALPLEHLRQIQKVCDAVGASLLGVIFRPCGSAAAVAHALGDTRISDETRLILTDEGTKVDLTLARGPLVFMSRSVRLTADDAASAAFAADPASSRLAANREFILNEVKRTLAAARVQNATTTIASLVICGASPAHEALAAECQQVFGLPAECVDHPPRWHRVAEAEAITDAEAEHFAPLVGAALLEAHPDWPRIDFLRPRQAPQPRDTRQLWTAVATVVLAIGLICSLGVWWGLASRDADILALRKRNTELDKLVEVANRQLRELEGLDEWFANSPNWLYELRELSRRLPGSDKMRLRRLQADITSSGGRITLQGVVDRAETVAQLEEDLRDERHHVEGLERNLTGEDPRHPWYFVERIDVVATRTEEMIRLLNAEPAAATRAASTIPPSAERATAADVEAAAPVSPEESPR